ncbi:MAG: histidinol-phosphate transaminase [Pseudomonadota bacterium]
MLTRRSFLGGSAAALSLAAVNPAFADILYGPADGVVKLNANENPYGPSPKAIKAMTEAINKGAYYADPSVQTLLSMISERFGVPQAQVSLSSGSSGALRSLASAMLKEGNVLGPDLFWDTTTRLAMQQGGELKRTAKTADMGIDLDALAASITPDIAMVQICNPNNPTGMMLDPDELRAFCIEASKTCTVLVDEAYNEITDDPDGNSMVDLVRDGHDVVVARTFSKVYGMAGLRVGYLLASPETTAKMRQFSNGKYNLNQAGVAGAVASFDDEAFLDYSRGKIREAREMIMDAVVENGLAAAPSTTSFVYVDLGDIDADVFKAAMAERNILIRGVYQDYTSWSRVSAGKLEDVEKYVRALPQVLDSVPRIVA